jgi:Flp pilus assembly protein TadB
MQLPGQNTKMDVLAVIVIVDVSVIIVAVVIILVSRCGYTRRLTTFTEQCLDQCFDFDIVVSREQ